MMKSFFKKLAFVMALAMVVSMAAPAGSALAAGLSVAYQAGGAVSELNLKAGAEQDLKFLGAPKNWKDLGWSWTSSNEAVATVDAAGVVTAVADGTATITITVGTLSGSVTVNVGDAKAYNVTLGTADNKAMTTAELKKGASLDLNFYGVKDWNKANYTVAWSVSGDAANVDKNGVVTAVKAGKAVVTASIVNNVTGVAHNVTPVEVTVAAEVNADAFTVAQKDTDKFVLTFNTAKDVDAIKENLTVSVKIGDKDFPISFENVAIDGNKVTVTTYAQFENDEVYTLTFGKEKVEHTIVLGGVYSVGVDYYTGKNKDNKVAYVTEEEENDYVTLVPILYDKYGNNITDKYNLKNFDFVYEVSENVMPAQIYNDTFAFDAAGLATVTTTVAWVDDNGEYVTVEGKSFIEVLKRGTIGLTLQKAGIAPVGWLASDTAYTYISDVAESFRLDPNSAVWNAWGGGCVGTSFEYRSVEAWRKLTYTAVFKDNRGNLVTSNNGGYQFGSFSYESTNNEVLTVDDYTGSVALYKPGKANILVYFTPADGNGTKKLVASTTITVTPEKYPASYKITKANITTAAHVVDEDLNDVKFKVQFYDQFGGVYDRDTDDLIKAMKIEARDSKNADKTYVDIKWNDEYDNCYSIKYDATMFADDLDTNLQKSYSYKFSLEDTDLTETIKTAYSVFTLTVKNTKTERDTLVAFLDSTKGDNDVYGEQPGTVSANYKFNISLGGSTSVDAAVKKVVGYIGQGYEPGLLVKGRDFSAKYLSTGNLALAHVPAELLVDNTTAKVKTGNVGYVYYKVSAPTKTTVAGNSVSNDAWDYGDAKGKVSLTFNAQADMAEFKDVATNAVFTAIPDADGTVQIVVPYGTTPLLKDQENWSKALFSELKVGKTYKYALYDATGTPSDIKVVYNGPVTNPNGAFKYAGNGSYTVNFSTTRTAGGNLYNIKTSTATVSNSQTQAKYIGLNPEKDGLTELTIADTTAALNAIAYEQLMFSFDEVFLGEYYEVDNRWGTHTLTYEEWVGGPTHTKTVNTYIDWANSKYVVGTDNVTFSTLAIVVSLDSGIENGNDGANLTYTTMVPVGARIKTK